MSAFSEFLPRKRVSVSMSRDEQAIENEIQAKSLNAPRLNPQHIDSLIVDEQYLSACGGTLTICVLTLRNGFQVTGESAAASPENFDAEIGRKVAREKAREKIWQLEGYLLRNHIAGFTVPGPAAYAANPNQPANMVATTSQPLSEAQARQTAEVVQLPRKASITNRSKLPIRIGVDDDKLQAQIVLPGHTLHMTVPARKIETDEVVIEFE